MLQLPNRSLLVALAWIESHCVVPDQELKGTPFRLTDEQALFLANHYIVKANAAPRPDGSMRGEAFEYRRSQLVRAQKWGKSPLIAAAVCLEAVGPALFAGWAEGGEKYRCSDHLCLCGWTYEYMPGEAMGRPWPSALIQITATSEEQTDNTYDALRPMIELGPLGEIIPRTGEEFIRLPNDGRIDTVTSKATSRLGQRVTFVPQDEALALDTPVPTPTGWTTIGDIRVGDTVLAVDGTPTRVVKTTEVQEGRVCYRVTFRDGTSLVTSDGHLWETRVAASAAKPKIRTTGEMFADGRTFGVPAHSPLELPEADLPVDPYLLGLWLGDGARGKCEITSGLADVDETSAILSARGIEHSIYRPAGGRAASIKFSRKSGFQGATRPEVAKRLREMPCFEAKHVPAAYLRGSYEQRLALLQGLMDSDGHVTVDGHCTFAGNEQLASDVVALLRTFGIYAQAVPRADSRARTGYGWKVNFKPRAGVVPFLMPRKRARVQQTERLEWATIASIEPVESVPVKCIGVAHERHLFLAGEGMHVTHNTGLWVASNGGHKLARTQRRGLAGMRGRSMETTNAWNPAEESVAQQTYETRAPDVYKDFRQPPAHLSFKNKRERRKIIEFNYAGAPWVVPEQIEADAFELLEKDPSDAERFFGNRIVAGEGSWMPAAKWAAKKEPRTVPDGTKVVLGFDGSTDDDNTGIRLETLDGYQFTPTYGDAQRETRWDPRDWNGKIPRLEVRAALDEIEARYDVVRAYMDPRLWESEIDQMAADYGEKVYIKWATYRPTAMWYALERFRTDVCNDDSSFRHDGNEGVTQQIQNAIIRARGVDPESGAKKYILGKPSPSQKIDDAMSSVLAHEAACDALAAGLGTTGPSNYIYY